MQFSVCVLYLSIKFKMTALATGGKQEWEQEAGGEAVPSPRGRCWQGEGGKSFGSESVLVPMVVADGGVGRGGRGSCPEATVRGKGGGIYQEGDD